MRTHPAVMPIATVLLAPSAPRRPQAPTARSTLPSPGPSSTAFSLSPLLPTAGAASSQQTSLVAEVTACQSAQHPSSVYMRCSNAASRITISHTRGRGSLHTGVRPRGSVSPLLLHRSMPAWLPLCRSRPLVAAPSLRAFSPSSVP